MTKRTQQRHTPKGAALTELTLTVFRANGRLLRAGDELMKHLGITSARWQVMGAVAERARTVAQIARHFELTRQGVLWVVSALVKDGLVELVDNPDHKRSKLVDFTARGRETYRELERRQIIWANAASAAFNLEELRRSTEVVERLAREGQEQAQTLGED
jgi:DNA-binding MarR family transcriptional regulator